MATYCPNARAELAVLSRETMAPAPAQVPTNRPVVAKSTPKVPASCPTSRMVTFEIPFPELAKLLQNRQRVRLGDLAVAVRTEDRSAFVVEPGRARQSDIGDLLVDVMRASPVGIRQPPTREYDGRNRRTIPLKIREARDVKVVVQRRRQL